MRVAVIRDYDEPIGIEEWPDPEPRGEEVVVTVAGAGMCHTDLHLLAWRNRPLPLVLGHEIAGYADGFGPVLVHQSWGCGACPPCVRGQDQLCVRIEEAGFERPGGYAEKVLVPSPRHLVPLGDLDPVRAAPLTDAAVTSFRAVRRTSAHLRTGDRVLVIGVGALGQFAVRFLRLQTPATVIAVDVDEHKRARAVELGAHEAVAPDQVDGDVFAVFDFVAEDTTLQLAADHILPGGFIMRVGSGEGSLLFGRRGGLPPEVALLSARGGSRADVEEVVRLAQQGLIEWDVETIPLERAAEGLERLRRGTVVGRLVLTPQVAGA